VIRMMLRTCIAHDAQVIKHRAGEGQGRVCACESQRGLDAINASWSSASRRCRRHGTDRGALQGPRSRCSPCATARHLCARGVPDHKRLADGRRGRTRAGWVGLPTPRLMTRRSTASSAVLVRRWMPCDANIDYRGVLYVGLMLTHGGPKVLEYNCASATECQVLMRRWMRTS